MPDEVKLEPFRVWQSGEWTILHVSAGGAETTSSLTRDQARLLSWKLRNSPRQAPEVPHWNGVGKYTPCISFDAGALNVNGGGFGDSDGSGCFVFRDDELDFEQDDGPLYRWINVSNSDLLHLRDRLNDLFPPATRPTAATDDVVAAAIRAALDLQGGSCADSLMDGKVVPDPAIYWFYEHQIDVKAIATAVVSALANAPTDDVVKELVEALGDARNNILSLLGGFRDDMPDVAVKLFQAQAKQIDTALARTGVTLNG